MALDAAALAAMRGTVTSLLPNTCTNQRTARSSAVWVAPDTREHHLPGASALVRMRRWVLTMPDSTDVQRFDLLTVVGMGTYWVAEVKNPESYSVSTEALCWQLTDAAGNSVDPISENATVRQFRQGTEIGSSRRVRFEPSMPGNVTPMGERIPDTVYTRATDDGWRLNDVLVLVSIDGFTSLPHPHEFRVQAPRYTSEPPSFIALELVGEAGGTQ